MAMYPNLGCCSSCGTVCATGELDLRLVFLLAVSFCGDRLSEGSTDLVEEAPLFDMREWGGGTSGMDSSGISVLGFAGSSSLQFLCICVWHIEFDLKTITTITQMLHRF